MIDEIRNYWPGAVTNKCNRIRSAPLVMPSRSLTTLSGKVGEVSYPQRWLDLRQPEFVGATDTKRLTLRVDERIPG